MEPGRRILLLSIRCVVFLALFFALWLAARAPYSAMIAAALDRLLPAIERPQITSSVAYDAKGDDILVTTPLILDPSLRTHGFRADFHFGVVLFAALLFATLPELRVWRRALLAVAGLVVLFGLHLAEVHVLNQAWYAFLGGNVTNSYTDRQRDVLNWTAQVLKHGEIAFPVALWVFAYFGLRRRPATPAGRAPSPSRSQPAGL